MKRLLELARGFPGHPSHPPLTDATIGAFTAGTLFAVLGALGFAERNMAIASYVTIAAGIVFAVVTIATGFLDYFRIRRGTPLRTTATIHWISNVTATALFVPAAALLQGAYETGDVTLPAVLLAVVAWGLLAFGGWVGGALVFVYGMRVQGETGTPTSEALKPHLPGD